MRFILLIIGGITAFFLVPMFLRIWDAITPTLFADVTDPFLLLWARILPYIIIAAVIGVMFLILRGKGEPR